MDRSDKTELERLLRALRHAQAALAQRRGRLIESFGDRLCGSGRGPSAEDLALLAALQALEQRAREDHALFLISLSLKQDDAQRRESQRST
jgi:hypothetical protein